MFWDEIIQFDKKIRFVRFLNLLCEARDKLCLDDFMEIWGEQLGSYVWRQEGSDLLKIWHSGLTAIEKGKLVNFLIEKYGDEE